MVEIIVSSDQSLCVEFGKTISEEINNKVCAFTLLAQKPAFPVLRSSFRLIAPWMCITGWKSCVMPS